MSEFTLASFNICSAHFREGKYSDDNLARLGECIIQSGADVVCLQEVDRGAARSNGVDMTAVLSDLTGLSYHYFIKIRNFQGGEYGTAILSRYPILESATLNYPVQIATQGTSCGYILLDVHGSSITVFNTHLSIENEESNTETLTCLAAVLKDHVSAGKGPFLCCGDFNTLPQKVAAYIPWVSLAHDGLTTYADRSIDHILYVSPVRVENTRTLNTQIDGVTDHNMVLTDVILN